jgi:hypothetical protein
MSKQLSRTKHTRNEKLWDQAIDDASVLLQRVEERAIRLRVAIAGFQQSKESGDPWPGTATALHTQSVSQSE